MRHPTLVLAVLLALSLFATLTSATVTDENTNNKDNVNVDEQQPDFEFDARAAVDDVNTAVVRPVTKLTNELSDTVSAAFKHMSLVDSPWTLSNSAKMPVRARRGRAPSRQEEANVPRKAEMPTFEELHKDTVSDISEFPPEVAKYFKQPNASGKKTSSKTMTKSFSSSSTSSKQSAPKPNRSSSSSSSSSSSTPSLFSTVRNWFVKTSHSVRRSILGARKNDRVSSAWTLSSDSMTGDDDSGDAFIPFVARQVDPTLPPASATPSTSVTPSASVSVSVTPSVSANESVSVSASPSVTASTSLAASASTSVTPSATGSISTTSTPSATVGTSSSATPTISTTSTPSATVGTSSSPSPTKGTSITPSTTSTTSLSPTASFSATASTTPSISVTITVSPSITASVTASVSAAQSSDPSPTSSASMSPSATRSVTPTASLSRSPRPEPVQPSPSASSSAGALAPIPDPVVCCPKLYIVKYGNRAGYGTIQSNRRPDIGFVNIEVRVFEGFFGGQKEGFYRTLIKATGQRRIMSTFYTFTYESVDFPGRKFLARGRNYRFREKKQFVRYYDGYNLDWFCYPYKYPISIGMFVRVCIKNRSGERGKRGGIPKKLCTSMQTTFTSRVLCESNENIDAPAQL